MYFAESVDRWDWLVYKGWHLVVQVEYCWFACWWCQWSIFGIFKNVKLLVLIAAKEELLSVLRSDTRELELSNVRIVSTFPKMWAFVHDKQIGCGKQAEGGGSVGAVPPPTGVMCRPKSSPILASTWPGRVLLPFCFFSWCWFLFQAQLKLTPPVPLDTAP